MLFRENEDVFFNEMDDVDDKDIKDAEKMTDDSTDVDISEEVEDIFDEGCGKKETVDIDDDGKEVVKEKKVCKEGDDEEDDVDDDDDMDEDDIEDVEESLIFDDDSYELYESVCGPFECNTSTQIDDIDSYVDDRERMFSSTTDEVDDIIDGHLSGEGADEIVPDSVDILGTNTDDFTFDNNGTDPEEIVNDEENEEDIFD